MQLANLDMIIRRWLLDRGYPIHYYMEAMFHSTTCIRELAKDTLSIVNTVNLPVNEYGAIDVPDDYKDDVALCFDAGLYLQKIPHKDNINPMRLISGTTGEFVEQPQGNTWDVNNNLFFGASAWVWFWNVDSYGEFTGRYFGANGGSDTGYKFIKQRRQIQLSGGFNSGNVILQYISNGLSIDNATQIEWDAFRAITCYIDWQRSANATNIYSPEGRTYYNERRTLRANLSDLTVEDVKDVLRSNYTAAIKS